MEKKKYVKIPFDVMKELIACTEFAETISENELYSSIDYIAACQEISRNAGFDSYADYFETLYSDEHIKKTYDAEIIEE